MVKKITVRLDDERYQILKRIQADTGKTQDRIFNELLLALDETIKETEPPSLIEQLKPALESHLRKVIRGI